MKKSNLTLTIIISLAIIILAFVLISALKKTSPESNICLKGNCFNVTIADTSEKRERGLMFVDKMLENEGMLFIFEQKGIYPFWMKNTLIPLDIIWLDENQNVVFVKENAQPCKAESCESFVPNATAKYVLEINAGLTNKLNINQ